MNKKLRVWYIDRVPADKTTKIDVNSIEEAKLVIKALTERDLNDDRITDNAMGFEEFDEQSQEWYEFEDEEGRDIDEIMSEDEE